MSRWKLSHGELPCSVGESKTCSVLRIPRGFQGSFKRRADGAYNPQPSPPSPSFIKTVPPPQLGMGDPGLRGEPHRFGIGLESTSVKWKPDSLGFLYRNVSSTQPLTVCPAREEEETALFHSFHHLKPFDGLDSCCLLIMGQTAQQEACCTNRSRNNPAIVWEKLVGHLGLRVFTSITPLLSWLGGALVEWRERSNEELWDLHAADWLWRTFQLNLCFRLLKIWWEGSRSHPTPAPGKQQRAPISERLAVVQKGCIPCGNVIRFQLSICVWGFVFF